MKLTDKKFIITGGAGFLGKHIIRILNNKYNIPEKNIFVPRSKDYDLREEKDIQKMFSVFKADIVIHLATVSGGLSYYKEHPGRVFYDILSMGTKLLHYSMKNKVKIFLATGTTLSYPQEAKSPYKEEDLWRGYPDEIEASYGVASKSLIPQSKAYRQEYGFDSRFIILSSLYGPGYNFNSPNPHMIPSLIKKFDNAVKNNLPEVELWGTGAALRDFLYVEDAAQAIIIALEKDIDSEPINIGSENEISVKEIAEKIKHLIGYNGKIVWDTSKPEGRLRRSLNCEKARKLLNFKPHTNIEDGLKKTVADYLNQK